MGLTSVIPLWQTSVMISLCFVVLLTVSCVVGKDEKPVEKQTSVEAQANTVVEQQNVWGQNSWCKPVGSPCVAGVDQCCERQGQHCIAPNPLTPQITVCAQTATCLPASSP